MSFNTNAAVLSVRLQEQAKQYTETVDLLLYFCWLLGSLKGAEMLQLDNTVIQVSQLSLTLGSVSTFFLEVVFSE